MTAFQQTEQLLSYLTRSEKSQLFQWLQKDLGDTTVGIESLPQVCGGEPCIVGSRIPVWVLAQARRLGTSEADLLRCYPTLTAQDLANAWIYIRSHPTDLERQILENEAT